MSWGVRMPTNSEITKVREGVARLYSIDLLGLQSDASSLSIAISSRTPPQSATVYATPLSGAPPSALIADLEMFEFSSISEDTGIRDRSIEQNLDEATRYLQTCTALRKEYGDLAKLYADTRLKSEEFFRLDDIHLQEVASGLYELPYNEATDELTAGQAGLAEANAQKKILDDLYSSTATGPKYATLLTDPQVKTYTDEAGQVASWSATQNQGSIQTGTSSLAQYKTKIEDASWQYSLRATNLKVSELTGKTATASRRQAYLHKDIGFRASRAGVSRQLAYVQLGENIRPNSILNYNERLGAVKATFDISLRKLIVRVLALKRAANALYGLDTTLATPPRGKIVDELSKWLLNLQDEVSKFRRRQRISIFTIWMSRWFLRRNMNLVDALKRREGLRADLNIEPDDLQSQVGLLRGVAFEYFGTGKRPLRLTVVPPSGATASLNATNPVGVPLIFGRVYPSAPALDIRPQFSDLLWNGNPFGTWRVSTDGSLADHGIQDIAMHLWVAY
jgi:hypothetical protein